MNKKVNISIVILGLVLTSGIYQNCSKVGVTDLAPQVEKLQSNSISTTPEPYITASFVNRSDLELNVTPVNVSQVFYECNNGQNGYLSVEITSVTKFSNSKDLTCEIIGRNELGQEVRATVSYTANACSADSVKLADGTCEQFKCKQFIEIAQNSASFSVPERTVEGLCFYKKILNKVAGGPSSGEKEISVLSRNHDSTGPGNDHPYIMGKSSQQFKLLGSRGVKLSGSSQSLAPILVDNFILVGNRPIEAPVQGTQFSAYGTRDASLVGLSNIQVNNQDVSLTPFASGGTATVNALLLTEQFTVNKSYTFSVDALDCGGAKNLSDVYLIFQ